MSKHANGDGSVPEKRILADVVEVQKQWIILDNRRADLAEKALEVKAAQDDRKYQMASKASDDNIALEKERLKRIGSIFWVVLGLAGVAVLTVLGFFFLGNETQRAAAASLVTPALIAVAGYGVIKTLVTAVKGLIGR